MGSLGRALPPQDEHDTWQNWYRLGCKFAHLKMSADILHREHSDNCEAEPALAKTLFLLADFETRLWNGGARDWNFVDYEARLCAIGQHHFRVFLFVYYHGCPLPEFGGNDWFHPVESVDSLAEVLHHWHSEYRCPAWSRPTYRDRVGVRDTDGNGERLWMAHAFSCLEDELFFRLFCKNDWKTKCFFDSDAESEDETDVS